MKLGNLARAAISAGAISILTTQLTKAQSQQDLETRIEQTQESALKQLEQAKIKDFRLFFSSLYEKIRKREFDSEQARENSRGYRRAMVHYLRDDVTRLLARYGVEFDIGDPSHDNYVIKMNDGFTVELYTPLGRGTLRFRKDDTATINFRYRYIYHVDENKESEAYFIRLKPAKTKPQPLDILLRGSQQSTGMNYFARDDFDEAYKVILELNREELNTNKLTDFFKYDSILMQKMEIVSDLKKIHGIDIYWYGAYVRAASGRILVGLAEPEMENSLKRTFSLVIFPNRTIFYTEYPDGTFIPKPLPQVMRSYKR